jgi:chemotaxis protein CheX
MEAKYAAVFIKSWNTVLNSFSSRLLLSADVDYPKDQADHKDIFVFMGLVGEISSQIYISMDTETGKILASEMLGGVEITEDELVTSAVGELCNMVMGNACTSISSAHMNVDITPPTIIHDQIQPDLIVKPSYCISFLHEDLKEIHFNVAVQ